MANSKYSERRFSVLPWFVGLTLIIFLACPLYGQVAGATVSGTVTDSSGAVVPNAKVSINNTATGVTRDVITDAAGFYSAPNLLPGNYDVSTSAPGFSSQVQTGITLTVGTQQVLNVSLQIGGVTQKIQVTSAAPSVQLATSSISAMVSPTTMRELPLNGRSWTDLATLQPGVSAVDNLATFQNGSKRSVYGFGSELTIGGQTPGHNNYLLDGVNIDNYSNAGPGSVSGVALGVDAIAEFSILSSNYPAEYGRTSGGVVNATTKSGTNQFHGTAYEFLRNSALDARNFFDGKTIPPFRQNQFGASAGGPIRKSSTFVFGDYEGIRSSKGITQISTVPSAAARTGALTGGAVTVDPSAAAYLALIPMPNGPVKGDTGTYTFPASQALSENFLTSRIDHKISENDSLFGTFVYDDSPYSIPDSYDDVLLGTHTNRVTAILEETHIFSPTLINSVRLGYSRSGASTNTSISASNPLAKSATLSVLGAGTAPAITAFGNGITPSTGGFGAPNIHKYAWNSWQAYDDAFLTRGTHSLRFGGNVERILLNAYGASFRDGDFGFSTLKNFLTNNPNLFQAWLPSSNTTLNYRQTIMGAYLQDDWRWRPNVTLNLGLRYEMATVVKEEHNLLAHLNSITDATQVLGSPLMPNPTKTNFEPRVGFSWDPFRKGKTAVRGGFGIYDVLPAPYMYYLKMGSNAPFNEQITVTNLSQLKGTFFTGASKFLTATPPNTALQAFYIDQTAPRSYVMQWNLDVQQEVTPSVTAMVGYVGSRGVHQEFFDGTADVAIAANTPNGLFWPNPHPLTGVGRINPNWSEVTSAIFFGGRSYFDALEASIDKRMSHGLQLQGSFTWSKSMDNASYLINSSQFSNSFDAQTWFDLPHTKALSDFDVPRTLVINGIWQVPEWKSAPRFAGGIANGWELGSIFKVSDGIPFTPTLGSSGDPLGGGSATGPQDFPNRLAGCNPINQSYKQNVLISSYINTQCFPAPTVTPATASLCDTTIGQPGQCLNQMGNSGRNIVIGPGIANLDFSLYKNNYIRRISENFNAQFRVEVFNILNRANFLPPAYSTNTDVFGPTGLPNSNVGKITGTSTNSREIQFALKLIW